MVPKKACAAAAFSDSDVSPVKALVTLNTGSGVRFPGPLRVDGPACQTQLSQEKEV